MQLAREQSSAQVFVDDGIYAVESSGTGCAGDGYAATARRNNYRSAFKQPTNRINAEH